MNIPRLLLTTLLAFLLGPSTVLSDNRPLQTRFDHQQPATVAVNTPVSLELGITSADMTGQARCYFRYSQNSNPVYVTARQEPAARHTFVLPAPGEGIETIQYCFLFQNNRQQVIRSPWYQVKVGQGSSQPEIQSRKPKVMTDLLLPDAPDRSSGGTGAIVEQEPDLLWLGMTASIYQPEDFPGVAVASGYFGGFLQDADAPPQAVKGFYPLHLPGEQPVRPLPEPGQSIQESTAKDGSENKDGFAGPLVDGSGWSGRYYIWPYGEGLKAITGRIVQLPFSSIADIIEVTTSLHGKGHSMTGTLSNTGKVSLTDGYDGEQWTTHNIPAELTTSSHFHCEDYVDSPLESKDTHRIDLDRISPPEPEPEPEPELSLLRGVLQLLL